MQEREWQWLQQAAEGDGDAFARIVERHQARLLRLCDRLLGDRGAAEEAVQEVFLRLYRNADRLEPRGQLFTLLYRMATNFCLNRLRRRRLVRFLPLVAERDGVEVSIEPTDDGPDPHRRLDDRERWRRMRRRIERLPPAQRTALVLVRFEGLSYRQAAEALGIGIGALESRLVRAMRTLEQEEGDER